MKVQSWPTCIAHYSCPKDEQWLISLNMALIIKEIWLLKNQAFYQGIHINIQVAISHIHFKMSKLSSLWNTNESTLLEHEPVQHSWIPPTLGWIKINTDAAISNNVSALAAIARNTKGEVLQVWTKLHISSSPLQAEAYAILWAVHF